MGMNINSAVEKLKTFLETYLTDPLSARTSAWIYDDGMRIDLDKTPYPKILIKKTEQPSLKEQLAIGNVATENMDEIVIQIKSLAGHHYTSIGQDYKSTAFVSKIGADAEDLIKNNHTYFVNQGFLDVLCIKDEITIDRDKNPIFNLTVQLHYISTPN